MTRYRCNSCGGEYDAEENGYLYFHICPEGTMLFPRDENLTYDVVEEDMEYPGRPKNVRPKKGKRRDKGGARKIAAVSA